MALTDLEMLVFGAVSEQDRAPMDSELTPQQRSVLDFEREWWQVPGRKDDEIRARFSMSPSSYYRTLHALIDDAAARAYDPMTVLRVRKRREQARRGRIEGRQADPRTR
jgi:hypothetical protein